VERLTEAILRMTNELPEGASVTRLRLLSYGANVRGLRIPAKQRRSQAPYVMSLDRDISSRS